MKVAAVQMVSGPAVEPNLETAARVVAGVAAMGARLDKGEGVIVAELHAERLAEVRVSLPALQHRKL